MPKVWPWLLSGWFVASAASGCSIDQRFLGSLAAPQGEAGTMPDVFVQAFDRPVDGSVDAPVDGVTDSQDAPAGEAGYGPEVWVPFGTPRLHPALLNAVASQADPTLTADELELYFSSNPNTDWDIWLVQRASGTDLWGTPARVDELSSTSLDETPEVSADGLTIYFASERPGGVPPGRRLWVARRGKRTDAWLPPEPLTDFTTGGDQDTSPTLQRDQLMMAFASLRGGDWDLYLTTRQSTADKWGPPTALTTLNSTAFDWDPALYRGGNSIVFASRRSNPTNSLFHSTRALATDIFSPPQEVTEFKVVGNAADPWLSDDGKHIVFDSRGGPSKIYEAFR
jgi:Tol biopolymer transport system component